MSWSDFYLICFLVGLVLSVVSFLLGTMGIGGDVADLGDVGDVAGAPSVDAPADVVAGDTHAPAHAGPHVSPLNFSTAMAFLAWFGGAGYLLTRFSGLTSLLALASAAPNAFPLSEMGYGSLHQLALVMIVPAAVGLLVAWALLISSGRWSLATMLVRGAVAGAIATLALEAVRYPGFRLGFMPGNLPRLMGVLLLDRFALGPSTLSDLAGFAYHAWNGASFGVVNDQIPLASLVMSNPAEPLTGVSPSFGMSVITRTFFALGAGSRKVMVLSAFTSGKRELVTTLASTPGPRPVGPLPPGGLLVI